MENKRCKMNFEMKTSKVIYDNLSVAELYEHAVRNGEAEITADGPLCARTGKFTARAPKDRFIVREPGSEKNIYWSDNNIACDEKLFDRMLAKVEKYLSDKDIFKRDCYSGADPENRLSVRIYNEYAWHSIFTHHLFIVPGKKDLENFTPDFTVVCAPGCKADPKADGTRSEAFILLNFRKRMVVIGGTAYAGEIKKSIFTVMNYLLPLKGVMVMHSSANIGKDKDTAIFFGLSGTGKTTLSSDPKRRLIGDDEHGWSDNGIFNFEGGCYAKVINLSEEAEPQIYSTTKRFGTILENVVYDEKTRKLNLDDNSLTENTRAAYPLEFIDTSIKGSTFPQPKNIVMLTYDAFGVLPPIARLSYEQAMYYFISGYTAKVANTEVGIKEPKATFSTCFGAPFMTHHPSVYAELLQKKMKENKASCWLLNTGLCGGPYGIGRRMSIKHTRTLLNAAIEGKLAGTKFVRDEIFGFDIPASCEGVPSEILNPRDTWTDKKAYDLKRIELAGLFNKNFVKFNVTNKEIIDAAPKI